MTLDGKSAVSSEFPIVKYISPPVVIMNNVIMSNVIMSNVIYRNFNKQS